jgi:putative transposase
LWIRVYDTIEELREALQEFARHYNENWLLARHVHQTPNQLRAAQLRVAKPNVGELPLAA